MQVTKETFNVCAGCPCPAVCQTDRYCVAESAVASHECGSVPDVRRRAINNVCINGHLNRALDDVLSSNSPDGKLCILGDLATKAIDEYIAALGMQPPSNQPNLICKSCGVDRSKEDCKGDRLRCGLAGIAYSDHVAVIGAKPDSVNLAAPVETSTDTSFYGALPEGMTVEWLFDHLAEESGVSPTRVKDAYLACFHDAAVKPVITEQDAEDAALTLLDWRKRAEKAENALAAFSSGISSPSYRPDDKTFADKTGTFADTSNCFVIGQEGKQ